MNTFTGRGDVGATDRTSHIVTEGYHNLFFSLRDKYGQTIVIVTHDPELAAMCDRSFFMRDGVFVEV